MSKVKIVKLHEDAVTPTRGDGSGRVGDAGLDFYSLTDVEFGPNDSRAVRTGIAVGLPKNTVGLVWSRSGLSFGKNVETGAGVIDENYTGEILVKLYNHGVRPLEIKKGDKIAQLLVMPILYPECEVVETLETTERGESGFGSTDVKTDKISIKKEDDAITNALSGLGNVMNNLKNSDSNAPPDLGVLFAGLFSALGNIPGLEKGEAKNEKKDDNLDSTD